MSSFEEKLISNVNAQLRYKIIDKVGEGTFSFVYKAFDGAQIVALKCIFGTSSLERIFDELSFIKRVSHCSTVTKLLGVERVDDTVILVLPFCPFDNFRETLHEWTLCDIKAYMRCLLNALSATAKAHIIHRDVKPSNFLFSRETQVGVLVDFGLAEVWHQKVEKENVGVKKRRKTQETAGIRRKAGCYIEEKRPELYASRAGTRGFRAPEVLLKIEDQTPAIDVWAAGITLLSMLSCCFPVFRANDDCDATVELLMLFGSEKIKELALKHDRLFRMNLQNIPEKSRLREFVISMRPTCYEIVSEETFDLLDKLLMIDPEQRISAENALLHPFLQ